MACSVDFNALLGIEQVNEHIVQDQKHEHEHKHEPHFTEFDMAHAERGETDDHQTDQDARVVCDHAGESEEKKKGELGRACELMDHAFAGKVVQNGISSHVHAPPGHSQ